MSIQQPFIRGSCSAPVELRFGSSSAPKLLFGACSVFKPKGVVGLFWVDLAPQEKLCKMRHHQHDTRMLSNRLGFFGCPKAEFRFYGSPVALGIVSERF